jgi:hemerythrin
MLIQWSESLSVKIAEIDGQHKKLIDLINELNEAMGQGKGRTVIGKIVEGLVSYTEYHFRTEERYFDLFGYPEKISHKKEHTAFVARVTAFKDDLAKGKIALSIEVMNFLSDWLRNHIKGVDMKYSPFFLEKGLK